MSTAAEIVTNAWYQKKVWILVLLPLAVLFWLISATRKALYTVGIFKQSRVSAPVIVVGNISVGGTGKSPLTAYVVSQLQMRGYKPGIVSRGYGGQGSDYPVVVTTESLAEHVGDEPLMLYQMTQCPVAVDPIRYRAALKLTQDYECDVIICDDGLQHYALHRDIEICVVDGQRKFGNGFVLPAGPLRETKGRLQSVDFTIVNGNCEHEEAIPSNADLTLHRMALVPGDLVNLFDGQTCTLEELKQKDVHAVAAIGNPERFFTLLAELGARIKQHSFSDHHSFSREDVQFNDELPVIMTEKDAVKCRQLFNGDAPDNLWYLPVKATIDESFITSLTQRLGELKLAK